MFHIQVASDKMLDLKESQYWLYFMIFRIDYIIWYYHTYPSTYKNYGAMKVYL